MTTSPGSVRAWMLAARPATLSAAFVPVAVGTGVAAAHGGPHWLAALAALFGASCIQIGTNFANDVFDFEKGADTEERLGPTRAAQAGLLSPRALRIGMVVSFGLATIAGAYLTWVAGPMIVAIGIASILSGIAYTGGPFPLGYHGLGDLFVMVFFGFVAVAGTVFVQLGHITALSLLAAVPVGSLATAILVVNNLRDRETDLRAGKRTLAARLGRGFALGEYYVLVASAYAVPLGLVVAGRVGALLPVLTLPLALRLCWRVSRAEGVDLNPLLGGTARLLLLHGVLFAMGLGAERWIAE